MHDGSMLRRYRDVWGYLLCDSTFYGFVAPRPSPALTAQTSVCLNTEFRNQSSGGAVLVLPSVRVGARVICTKTATTFSTILYFSVSDVIVNL